MEPRRTPKRASAAPIARRAALLLGASALALAGCGALRARAEYYATPRVLVAPAAGRVADLALVRQAAARLVAAPPPGVSIQALDQAVAGRDACAVGHGRGATHVLLISHRVRQRPETRCAERAWAEAAPCPPHTPRCTNRGDWRCVRSEPTGRQVVEMRMEWRVEALESECTRWAPAAREKTRVFFGTGVAADPREAGAAAARELRAGLDAVTPRDLARLLAR